MCNHRKPFCFLCSISLHRVIVAKARETPCPLNAWARMGTDVSPAPLTAPTLKTDTMSEEMKQMAELIAVNTILCTKEVLTTDEAAKYLGVSKSYLYKLTMQQKIPHYKPLGKMCYFNRVELEQWLQSNRVATEDEISQKAQNYCMKKGARR